MGYSNEIKKKFYDLRAKGYSFRNISKEIGVSIGVQSEWERDGAQEISALKMIDLDGIYDEYAQTKSDRIQSLAQTLSTVDDALDSRYKEDGFEDAKISELLSLKLKYMDQLEKEKSQYALVEGIDLSKLNVKEVIALVLLIAKAKGDKINEAEFNIETHDGALQLARRFLK